MKYDCHIWAWRKYAAPSRQERVVAMRELGKTYLEIGAALGVTAGRAGNIFAAAKRRARVRGDRRAKVIALSASYQASQTSA